jgi:putative transposase
VTTRQRRQAVTHLLAAYPVSARRACRLVRLSRSRWQYRSRRGDDAELRGRLRELASRKPRWGYQQLHVLLRREGIVVNHKKVLRLYREEGLAVTRRRRRKHVAASRVPLPRPTRRTERWSMDFVSDALASGRSFRCFTVVDDFTRECPAIEVAHSLRGWKGYFPAAPHHLCSPSKAPLMAGWVTVALLELLPAPAGAWVVSPDS